MCEHRLEKEGEVSAAVTVDIPQVPKEAQERFYESWRIQEWIGTTSKVLNLRLQPGFVMFGKGLPLPSLSFHIASKYFELMKPDKIFTRKYRPITDGKRGERIVERVYFVFETHLPNFGWLWYVRNHGDNCSAWSPEYE
jgi:hypothetical protein